MDVYRVKTGSILPLGKQGENLSRQIQFDLSRWISNFGPGTVQLLHQRSGDETPYPVAVEQEGNLAVWTVTSADTAVAGTGRAELQYYVGDALAKSETWMTKVLPALGPASETPPEAQQGWVDQVLAQVARITGMTAQAVELPAGSAPTADYADGVLTIGIPLGGDVSEAQIAQAVEEYLSTNPIAETDPTVPAWAKEEKKPSYTAAEVGADPSGTAESKVAAHNTGTDTHSDIRLLIQGLTERLNTLADSDDTTLDQLSEVVSYIKSNRTLIEAITTSKVSVADIIDNLTTNVTNKPLSAAQGVALKALIDAITIPTALPNPNALTFTGAVTGRYDGSAPVSVEIPSGGGSGGSADTSTIQETVLASGTVSSGTAQWHRTDTGLTAGDLKEWKIWGFRCVGTTAFNGIIIGPVQIKLDGIKCQAILGWADSERKAIQIIDAVSNGGYESIGISFFRNGLILNSNQKGLYAYFQVIKNETDAVYIYTHSELTADLQWEIRGLIK